MFRARVILGYIAASSATLFLAARADGRSRAVQSSLEARIAGADVVILGVASQIRTFKKTGADWCIVTVRVDEVFKGLNGPHDVPALRFLEYAEPSSGNWPPLERRFLFFVSRGSSHISEDANYARFKWVSAPWVSAPWFGGALAVDPDTRALKRPLSYTVDDEPLTTAEELLSHARKYCNAESGQPKPKLGCLDMGMFLLDIPLDAYTARRAREWARSGDQSRKWLAVDFLGQYRSAEDVPFLKSMLEDSAAIETGKGPRLARYFYRRKRVWAILQNMGVSVAKPQLEEGLISYQPARLRLSFKAALALPFLLITFRRCRRWLSRNWSILIPTLAAVTITIFWLISTHKFDEWVLDGTRRQRLASFDQHVQYEISNEWSGNPRFIHGGFPLDDTIRREFDAREGPTSEMVLAELNDLDPGIERFETYREAKSCWEHAGIAVVKGECPDPTGTTRKYTAFRVHYADLLALALFPVVVSFALRIRGAVRLRRRTRLGLCRVCGYDLRLGSGRCPECGTPC